MGSKKTGEILMPQMESSKRELFPSGGELKSWQTASSSSSSSNNSNNSMQDLWPQNELLGKHGGML